MDIEHFLYSKNKFDAIDQIKEDSTMFVTALFLMDIENLSDDDMIKMVNNILFFGSGFDVFQYKGGRLDINNASLMIRIDRSLHSLHYNDKVGLLKLGYTSIELEQSTLASPIYAITGKNILQGYGIDDSFESFMNDTYYFRRCLQKYPDFLEQCLYYIEFNTDEIREKLLGIRDQEDAMFYSPHGLNWAIKPDIYLEFLRIVKEEYNNTQTYPFNRMSKYPSDVLFQYQ